MGQIFSTPIPALPSFTVQGSATLPMNKTPVLDGVSGLHYSGQTYMNNVPTMSASICSTTITYTDPKLRTPFPLGVAPMPNNLSIDPTTNRISTAAIQGYVQQLQESGRVPREVGTITEQIAADKLFYANVQTEYCYYEARYIASLAQFITEVSNNNATPTSGQAALNDTIAFNKALNTLLEIINYVGNDRAQKVNNRNSEINSANQKINDRLAELQAQQAFLNSSDVRLQTQSEMMRYSKEKNSAMNIQIMFFVALNVVALGTVFMVYKNVRPSS